MGKFLVIIGWKTITNKWDWEEIQFDLIVLAIVTLVVIVSYLEYKGL